MVCVGRLGLSSKELEFNCDYIIFNIRALFKHILIFNKGPCGVSIKSMMILEQRGCRIVKEYCTIRLLFLRDNRHHRWKIKCALSTKDLV